MLITTLIVGALGAAGAVGAVKVRAVGKKKKDAERAKEDRQEALLDASLKRFKEAGFKVRKGRVTPRVDHVSQVQMHFGEMEDCRYCKPVRKLWLREIVQGGQTHLAEANYVGQFCPECGDFKRTNDAKDSGLIGALMNSKTGNIFDLLEMLASKQGRPVHEALEAQLAKIEERLESRLADVRLRQLEVAERLGRVLPGAPYRPQLTAGEQKS